MFMILTFISFNLEINSSNYSPACRISACGIFGSTEWKLTISVLYVQSGCEINRYPQRKQSNLRKQDPLSVTK